MKVRHSHLETGREESIIYRFIRSPSSISQVISRKELFLGIAEVSSQRKISYQKKRWRPAVQDPAQAGKVPNQMCLAVQDQLRTDKVSNNKSTKSWREMQAEFWKDRRDKSPMVP